MKKSFLLSCLLMGLMLMGPRALFAQDVQVEISKKVTTAGNKQFYLHHVKAGETLYALSKAYHVDQDEIARMNPEVLERGLQAGMVLGIPVVEVKEEPVAQQPVVPATSEQQPDDGQQTLRSLPKGDTIVQIGAKKYVMHFVQKGETVWGLSKTYHVTQQEIMAKNPEIAEGLKEGMVIGIPYVIKEEPQEEPKVEEPKVEEPKVEEPKVEEPEKEEPIVEEPKIEKPKADEPVAIRVEGTDDGDGYRVYEVKKTERTKKLLRTLNVDIDDFRMMNPSVGSMVFAGQKILIPVENNPASGTAAQNPAGNDQPGSDGQPSDHPSVIVVPISTQPEGDTESAEDQPSDEELVNEELPFDRLLFSEDDRPDECFASSYRNADRLYKVALLTPLYLNEIDKLDTSKDRIEKTKKSRALKFLQFYEGFMMAVDSLTEYEGLRLDLTVMDVTENTAGAQEAVQKLRENPVDIIIGPFFSKSFAIVQEYAAESSTLIVNPMSERESILSDAPFVVKLKPGPMSMISELRRLLQTQYPYAKVSLLVDGSIAQSDSLLVDTLETALAASVPPEVEISNTELLDIIAKESQRRKMGKKTLSTLEIEGQIFSTKSLQEHPDGSAFFENHFQRYSFKDSEIKDLKEGLSSGRDNVLIAYGDDIVFATKLLNNINKSMQKYPVTLIGLPHWEEFENLLVESLLNMNAIYFEDHFVDYNDSVVQKFVDDFRVKYDSEPMDYAFEGFDVGWYFLNALMQFGSHPMDCLPYYHLPLLHSRYYFNKTRSNNGLENHYWNIYQYDKQAIELKPIHVHGEE